MTSPSFLYSVSTGAVFASCFLADISVEETTTTNGMATVTSSAGRKGDRDRLKTSVSETFKARLSLKIYRTVTLDTISIWYEK